MKKLIILNQRIVDWEKKGEIQKNYFNPDNKYKKIIIISFLKKGKPSNESLKIICGKAKFEYIEIKNFFLTNNFIRFFLPFFLYKNLINNELSHLKLEKPSTVRCFGDGYIGYLSSLISSYYSCPIIISIHTYFKLDIFLKYYSIREKIFYLLNLRFKSKSHKLSNKILVVYKKISENIDKKYLGKIELSYNQIYVDKIHEKKATKIGKICNLVFVGRLIKGKSVLNIIKALKKIDNVNLSIYGDGSEKRRIESFIKLNNLENRIFLKGFQNNKKILFDLKSYDAFIGFHKYYEFPKTIIEALLVGLPIILNKNPSLFLEEFEDLKILWTDDNPESYRRTIECFIDKKFNIEYNQENNKKEIKKILKKKNV